MFIYDSIFFIRGWQGSENYVSLKLYDKLLNFARSEPDIELDHNRCQVNLMQECVRTKSRPSRGALFLLAENNILALRSKKCIRVQ